MWQIPLSEHCSVGLVGWRHGLLTRWTNVEVQLRPGFLGRLGRKHDWGATYLPEQLVSVCCVCRVCCGVVFVFQVIFVCGQHIRGRKMGGRVSVFSVAAVMCRKDTM